MQRNGVRGATHEQWRCRRSTERDVSHDGGGLAESAAAATTGARPVVATEPRPPLDGHALFPPPRACHGPPCTTMGVAGPGREGGTTSAAAFRQYAGVTPCPRRGRRVHVWDTRCFGAMHANGRTLPRRHSIARSSVNNTAFCPRFVHGANCYDTQ